MSDSSVFQSFMKDVIEPADRNTRILMVGDVVGKPGRKVLKTVLHLFRETVYPDLVQINAENIAGGFGITIKIHDEMLEAGVDVMTMGNHWNDKPDVHKLRRTSAAMVLPQNLKDVEGVTRIPEFAIRRTHRTARVLNLMGQFAMKETYENPFTWLNQVENQLARERESGKSMILTDFHAEASSEKQAVAWKLDGIATAQIGTHTHTPTSDERITAMGSAFLTDVGMTGPYESVIGMEIQRTLGRYFAPDGQKRAHEVAKNDPWFCGFLVEASAETGLAVRAHRLQFRQDSNHWTISTVHPAGLRKT